MSVQGRLDIDSGPRYRLAADGIDYVGAAAPEEDLRPTLPGIGIEPGMPARAPVVVAAGQAPVERLRERGHPFARVAVRKPVIHRDLDELTVQLAVNAGPPPTFGPPPLNRRAAGEECHLRAPPD